LRGHAELVRLGTINSKNLWIVCWSTAFNSEVVMKAQAKILAKADSDAAASAYAASLEFAQAEVAAAAAKERRGNKGDGTMSGGDLAAAVKFVHLKKSAKGWSKYDTKGCRASAFSSWGRFCPLGPRFWFVTPLPRLRSWRRRRQSQLGRVLQAALPPPGCPPPPPPPSRTRRRAR
jgi:hypothetical protein